MIECSCTVQWRKNASDAFAGGRFSREHTWYFDGGPVIPASASPHIVPVPFSNPQHVDPEEAFVAAVASCHMLTFLYLACRDGLIVEAYSDTPVGILDSDEDGCLAMTEVILRPVVAFAAPVAGERLTRLHAEAHRRCLIARSIRTDVRIEHEQQCTQV
jgi:organic hydroperoxide reductase OsmC/OhrA